MSNIIRWLSVALGLVFHWLFGLSHNFLISLFVILLVLGVMTLPVYLKKAKTKAIQRAFNKELAAVKKETREKYPGNTKIFNRMCYEFSKANRPKPPVSYIAVKAAELLLACSLLSVICSPISGVGGLGVREAESVLAECGCSSEIEAVRLFSEGNETVLDALENALPSGGIERLNAYVEQMSVFGVNLFEKPDFSEFSASCVIPIINILMTLVFFYRTAKSLLSLEKLSVMFCVFSFLSSALSILLTFTLPVSLTLYLLLRRIISLLRSVFIKQMLRKKPPVVTFKKIDLRQFEDLREELAAEEAKERVSQEVAARN